MSDQNSQHIIDFKSKLRHFNIDNIEKYWSNIFCYNIARMNSNSHLLSLIEGCLNPNTVQASEQKLVEYSNRPSFVS